MKTYKEQTITRKIDDKYFCDKCGKEISDFGDYILYNTFKAHKEYAAWGDRWTDWKFEIEDLCEECCKDLAKLLKESGYKLKEEGLDNE